MGLVSGFGVVRFIRAGCAGEDSGPDVWAVSPFQTAMAGCGTRLAAFFHFRRIHCAML